MGLDPGTNGFAAEERPCSGCLVTTLAMWAVKIRRAWAGFSRQLGCRPRGTARFIAVLEKTLSIWANQVARLFNSDHHPFYYYAQHAPWVGRVRFSILLLSYKVGA